MWSYYGRKYKFINKYPKPIYDLIIEPFAGTGSYAYRYWEHDVILIDKYDVIIRIWKYLQQAKSQDILSLPDVENAECILDKYEWLCEEERWLIGFCINNASPRPKHTAGRMNFNSWKRDKIRIANDLYKIRHWAFVLGEYNCLENVGASWYIDPPYQFQNLYVSNKLDYSMLSEWCKTRDGQVIVCEDGRSDRWLDFGYLTTLNGQRTKASKEVMWYKE